MFQKNKTAMDKNIIFVKNFETQCLIGVYPEEKKKKQKIKISVKLEFVRLKQSDNVSNTLSYEKIINHLQKINTLGHINLVETLANKIFYNFKSIKNVRYVEIEIVKCNLFKGNTEVGFLLKKSINR